MCCHNFKRHKNFSSTLKIKYNKICIKNHKFYCDFYGMESKMLQKDIFCRNYIQSSFYGFWEFFILEFDWENWRFMDIRFCRIFLMNLIKFHPKLEKSTQN